MLLSALRCPSQSSTGTKIAILRFPNSIDSNRGSAELIDRGFDIQHLEARTDDDDDWTDDSPNPLVTAWTLSDLDDDSFSDSVQHVVEPTGGNVLVAGPGMMQRCSCCGRLWPIMSNSLP
jgi:hypothetical protein